MLGLIKWCFRKIWSLTCIASLVPISVKATHHGFAHWSWVEVAALPVGLCAAEMLAQCACSRIRAAPTKQPSMA